MTTVQTYQNSDTVSNTSKSRGSSVIVVTKFWDGRPGNPVTVRALAHTPAFCRSSDPAPVAEFFTCAGITAAGGQLEFERCTRKMFVK